MIDTKIDNFKLRFAQIEDAPLLLDFIKELAEYEHMLDEVVATVEDLRESLFERKTAEIIIGEYDKKPLLCSFIITLLFWGNLECIWRIYILSLR